MDKNKMPLILVSLLSVLIFASRMISHQPNLTPVLALCLFSGFLAKGRWYSMVLPMFALVLSDWQIGFYPGWVFNYVSLVLVLFSGVMMKGRLSSFAGFGILGATQFFLLSNLGVWMFTKMYPLTLEGLIQSYGMGLPFFKATLLSTTAFMVVFYGIYAGVRQLQTQSSEEVI